MGINIRITGRKRWSTSVHTGKWRTETTFDDDDDELIQFCSVSFGWGGAVATCSFVGGVWRKGAEARLLYFPFFMPDYQEGRIVGLRRSLSDL
jgi:hypothetical protein